MKIQTIISALEEAAPLALQESYDNSGLQVGDPQAEVQAALICVDITEAVVHEAVERQAGLIISHHPPLFRPLRQLSVGTYVERAVLEAVRHGVAIYSCHTNLDAAPEGMSVVLGGMLGLVQMQPLEPSAAMSGAGMGVVGSLEQPVALAEFLGHLKRTLGTGCVRYSRPVSQTVRRVAVCTGAGASLMRSAKHHGADIYVSSDFKYNDFLDADRDITIADVGHFESEYCAINLIYEIIRKKITNFALYRSEQSFNPVNYLV